jgi:hypothetical protein
MAERDYPIGHPAASDYKGEKYRPPRAPFADDYNIDHPAYQGRNTHAIDTPDGMRAEVLANDAANVERTAAMQQTEESPDVDEATEQPANVQSIKPVGRV